MLPHIDPKPLLFAAAIVGAWVLLALAWTPATLMIEQSGGRGPNGGAVFLHIVAGFVPWMAATPLMLRLARLFPVGQRRVPHLLLHATLGVVVVPAVAISGRALALIALPGWGSWGNFTSAVVVTALYSLPIYVAVAAIGQVLAGSSRPSSAAEAYPRRLAIREKGRTEVVDTGEIDYVDVAGHYLCIHAGEAVHITRGQLRDLERRLDPAAFARVHRSTIVRLDRIRAFDERRNGDCELMLANGRRIAASRGYRALLQERLDMADLQGAA